MAFQIGNLTLWSAKPEHNNASGLPQWWGYLTAVNSIANVSAAGYFNLGGAPLLQNTTFNIGDRLYCVCSDGVEELYITALSPNITTAAV